jgi:hypothetical protein
MRPEQNREHARVSINCILAKTRPPLLLVEPIVQNYPQHLHLKLVVKKRIMTNIYDFGSQ